MKFRKKPVVIDAQRVLESFSINTLEGEMLAGEGDWLITGVHGEQYPCKDDIFRETYEPVDEEAIHAFFNDEIEEECMCLPFPGR